MSGFWPSSFTTIQDLNGKPIVGAKAYFYAAGTTTPITVYRDYGLTTAHPNPLETDGYGRFPAVFLDEADEFYRVRVTTPGGSILYDSDTLPIIGPTEGGGSPPAPVDPNSLLETGDIKVRYGEGCRFTGIQFELDTITTRANAWIRVAHSECYIEDIFWQSAALGIVVENGGTACRIKDVTGVYGADPGAGSSMIRVLGATGVTIDGVRIPTSSTLAPTAMVHAGGSGASAISGLSVENTSGVGPCLHVHLQASAANISHVIINGVRYNGFAGTAPAQVIKLETASTFSIDGVSISDFQINSHPTAGISLVQASSGVLENVTMSNGVIVGASGNGVEFIRTAGTLGSVRIDGTVDASERATPFSYSGTVSDIQISPQALPNVNSAFSYFFTIADDSVATIDLRRSVFSGAVHLTAGSARHGIFTIRAASTPTVSANRVTDANTVATAAVLTGTTGTDGNLTLGVQSGVLYIENRLGSSQSVSVTVMAA
ncbi:hypothetical protein ABIA25_002059 [Sinorhizobium fredii]|uniref:hypothetical protein n=1 Tax=Rhizobium fredii TaxID=380 RepID=UPI003512666F